jgi:hypothetical protein
MPPPLPSCSITVTGEAAREWCSAVPGNETLGYSEKFMTLPSRKRERGKGKNNVGRRRLSRRHSRYVVVVVVVVVVALGMKRRKWRRDFGEGQNGAERGRRQQDAIGGRNKEQRMRPYMFYKERNVRWQM